MAAESKPKLKMSLTLEDGRQMEYEGRGLITFVFNDMMPGVNNVSAIHHGHLSSMELASELAQICRADEDDGFGPVSELWQKALTLYMMEMVSSGKGRTILNKAISEADAFAAGAIAEAEREEEDSE